MVALALAITSGSLSLSTLALAVKRIYKEDGFPMIFCIYLLENPQRILEIQSITRERLPYFLHGSNTSVLIEVPNSAPQTVVAGNPVESHNRFQHRNL